MYQSMQSPSGPYFRKDWTFEVDGAPHSATVMWPERGALRNPFKKMPFGARAFLDGRELWIVVGSMRDALWFVPGTFRGISEKLGGVFAVALIGAHKVRIGVSLWDGRAPYLFVDRWDVTNGVMLPEDFPWPLTESQYRSVLRIRKFYLILFGTVGVVVLGLLVATSMGPPS